MRAIWCYSNFHRNTLNNSYCNGCGYSHGLLSAIYLSEYAKPKIRATIKPILEILAGVPTVVYSFFAAITVGPFKRNSLIFGFSIASESALAAGGVMGIMIIPFISSLSDDVMSVPQSMRDGSYAVGATNQKQLNKLFCLQLFRCCCSNSSSVSGQLEKQ